jgi:hypothetical protein
LLEYLGNVFWKFCEEQVKAESGDSAEEEEEEDNMEEESNIKATTTTLPMPPMIPILLNKKLATATPTKKPIPPPPPLAVIMPPTKTSSLPSSTPNNSQPYQSKARHFLPKSLAPKPKLLPSSITITPTNTFHHKGGGGGNGITGPPLTGLSILKDKICSEATNNDVKNVVTRKSPAAGPISKQTSLRLSTSASSIKANIQLIPTTQNLDNNIQQDYQDYYQGIYILKRQSHFIYRKVF